MRLRFLELLRRAYADTADPEVAGNGVKVCVIVWRSFNVAVERFNGAVAPKTPLTMPYLSAISEKHRVVV